MRKELDVIITSGTPETNRDYGKTFQIREMSASKAEKWAMRALLAVARSGVDLPEGMPEGGMQSIAILGIQAVMKLDFYDAEPLLDEMMECIRIKPDPKNPAIIRNLIDDDIEEIATRIKLREEVIRLHLGFFTGVGASSQTSEMTSSPALSNIQTSPEASVRFSRREK